MLDERSHFSNVHDQRSKGYVQVFRTGIRYESRFGGLLVTVSMSAQIKSTGHRAICLVLQYGVD